MKSILLLTLFATLIFGQELEKEIQYIGNDGKTITHKIICKNGKSGIVSIDNATQEMSIGSQNLGKVTFSVAVKLICG